MVGFCWRGVPGTMSSLSRELVFLILQFLDEEKFMETVHKLEQESGFFFNMKHFEDQVQAGEWDEVERYLCGFTKVEDNRYSMKIFFEIRKQKYLEALDRQDRAKAVEILVKDLKVFASFNEELFKEITQLLTLDNFRQNEQLSKYGDTKSARNIMLVELKKLIEANPLFRDKLTFPAFKSSRLRTLINQSLNWQHQLCKNPRPNPDIKTLFTDHSCLPTSNGARPPPPTNGPLVGPISKAGVFPPVVAHGPFQPVVSPSSGAIAGWMPSGNPSLPHAAAVAAAPPGLVQPSNAAAFLKHPRTQSGMPGMDYQSADSEHLMKRIRTGQSDEVSFSGISHTPNVYSQDDLPKTVVRAFNQGSNVMSMDFHPQQQTILLVGTKVGDISLWEVGSRERLAHKPFKVWDISAVSMPLQTSLVNDAVISVNRCVWAPDGLMLGVAFSKHIVQIYHYNPAGELRQHLEIDAHVGGVNDIAFAHPNKQLCIVTCGDDKMIKVWDTVAGCGLYTFEGHEAPVYSVCPHHKENIQFIFSTAIDGKIKAWLYDCLGSRVDYDAPGLWCTTMAYSADGTRLFSCGTSKDGESHLVEWNESEGAIKRRYSGFRNRSLGVVQFDTTRNRLLAAGDEFQIKFWDMDDTTMLTAVDADGGLPASPRLRFNKEGSLLAVTTSDNSIKILANGDGSRMIRMLESRVVDKSQGPSEPVNSKQLIVNALGPVGNAAIAPALERPDRVLPAQSGNMDNSRLVDVKPRISDDTDKIRGWRIPDIMEPSHLKVLRLPDAIAAGKVVRLLYTNSGLALLALASNAVHKLWKWQRSERSPLGKVKTKLKGHQNRITGLAFSQTLNSLVSSGADAQLCVWSIDGWGKKKSSFIQAPAGRQSPLAGETKVQFHNDQTHLLVVHESQIAIYDSKLECLRSWSPKDSLNAPISSAIYSCDGSLVYTGFCDGAVGVFYSDNLRVRCRIAPSAYIPSFSVSSNSAYAVVIAAHPTEPNQIALGMSDGAVHVVEPSDVELKWGAKPSQNNGSLPSSSSNPSLSGQPTELPSR
ncbi:protein TPR2-like isoform X3 [Durio zibethinus]|uniref:Protein TPR2-like isoform X3 n=1 Tax=Durio zibethinus TaxID=66656 RepID=A0A6P5YYE8_DURZI|nr:protein TPR2-like isoform X3 [Durio zibethinus]